ncbi:hypothetical protein QYE76_046719 [Lolium multiflorum]|uniref:Reverse transcriptase domain-containing protein n=1 Tax=Lolium multiflorum TaxID=4521 RepID=A0AAD8TQH2_LOLMU|nr:hypothetical protein QYE76_046719 [Lolium multiflorum]
MNLAVKNYCSVGTISEVTIIDFEDLALGSAPSSGSDPESIPAAASSVDDEEFVEFGGGAGYADAMEMLGVPPPLVPHGEPFGAAPAASLVAHALANAPPLPSVHGCPVLSKPTSVQVQLRLGFFDVTVSGSLGEHLSFRLPLRKAASDMGSKGLMVANFVTASVGLLDSVALHGPLRRPVISVDILARSVDAGSGTPIPLAVADALVKGTLAEALPLTGAATAETGGPLPRQLPAEDAPSATTTLGLGGHAGATLEAPLPSASPVRSPPVLLLAGEVSPVAGTVWRAPPIPPQPRRCSRLATERYVSIIDKAIARILVINGGPSAAPSRSGELSPDDLLAVALDDSGHLPRQDVNLCLKLKRVRAAARAWARHRKLPPVYLANCRAVISFLDRLEESRPLSTLESRLRYLAKTNLSLKNADRATYWRQRAKIKNCILGDENTKYFHLCASGRLQKNQIKNLDSDDDITVFSHHAKASILHAFFKELLGTPIHAVDRPDWDTLVASTSLDSTQVASIIHPFSIEEIRAALFSMNDNSSPGPDGFGPAFYKRNWDLVKSTLLDSLADFHSLSSDLRPINKSHIVLLPKKEGANRPDNFRPISLQNCCLKIHSKCLTLRLKYLIPSLVHQDQTGFISGRSIAENFVYTADLVQACHKRNAPAAVFKLDFRKAFDSISWDALDRILMAKGFPELWRAWIKMLNHTSQMTVLLNGVPGRWIQCRRGLRQGDPLSPFLFNIIVDVLQQMLLHASREGLLQHPLVDDLTCPVLQYADDTLIIIRAIPEHVANLKRILDEFSAATGLTINFHRSTFVPIKTDPDTALTIATTFGCAISSFPQTYLGLPLSIYKMRFADFAPIIHKSDMRLSGWRGRCLPIGGRLILVNSVLTAMLAHAMSAGLLPAGVIEAIDKRRRAFLWTGEETCNGGSCKVA